jgi:phage/plasmid primase-like uncharacterized protein
MAMRQRYPNAQIIIAADNDQSSESDGIGGVKVNTGKEAAEKAAKAVSGWVSMPPVDYKADWNDYHQQYGLEAATAAFNDSMYQPKGKKVGATLTAIDGGKKKPWYRRRSETASREPCGWHSLDHPESGQRHRGNYQYRGVAMLSAGDCWCGE